ncbi:hypothetical protein LguiB_018553 [Lonicera macranthoides]
MSVIKKSKRQVVAVNETKRHAMCHGSIELRFYGSSFYVRDVEKEALYNKPELAKKYKVYAVDLFGFGWSEKAFVEYNAMVWRHQVADFLKEIVKEPTILVGNGLGGFTALVAAETLPEQVVGVAPVKSAGQFLKPDDAMQMICIL